VLADYPGLANHSIEALLWNLDRVPEEIYPLARFYGGGCANHQLFWKVMAPALAAADAPTGALADAIDEAFGGLDAFVEAFTDAALSVFGSGWAFLTTDEEGTLRIEATANNDNPLTDGRGALFVLDCWEHAYYLSYRHRRDEYVEAWWNVLDWATADDRYDRIPESIERFERERH
jgi:Fe-Mn family superoxide dismutase